MTKTNGPRASYPRRLAAIGSVAFLAGTVGIASLSLGCTTSGANSNRGQWGGTAANGSGTARASNGWYSIRLGGSSVMSVPKQPTQESSSMRMADGARLSTTSYAVSFGPAAFLTFVNDFEGGIAGDPIDTADQMLDAFLENTEGFELVTADAVVREGYPGTTAELRNPRDNRRLLIQQYAGRSRVYLFASLNGQLANQELARVEAQYFASIRLDPTDAPSPAGDGHLDFNAFASIQPPEAGIAVELPGNPRHDRRVANIAGEPVRVLEYSTATPDRLTAIVVRVFHFDDRPDDVLTHLRDLAREGEGDIGEIRPAQRQGFGGQAYVIRSSTRIRYVVDLLAPGGAVQMVHSVPLGQEAAQADFRRRFLNSLRFL